MAWTEKQLADVVERNEAWLLKQAGIVGVAVSLDPVRGFCVEVMTDQISEPVRRTVKERLKEVPLRFADIGPIEALRPDS